MIRSSPILATAAALAALLAGCSTPSYFSPVEVTRFTAPPASAVPRGAIDVRPAAGQDIADPAYAAYRAAVAEQLGAVGYQVAADGAAYVALIDVERFVGRAGGRAGGGRGPVSVGGGASTGSYGSGVGLGVGIDLSPPDPDEVDTQLSVSIRPAAGGDALWEGRARFTATANNEFAELPAAAAKVSAALFGGFPGNSGETIEVE